MEIYGNVPVKNSLQRAILQNRISNAYVFEGMEGVGKRTTAEVFARGLLCTGEGKKPCDVCADCRRLLAKNHPDILYLMPTEGRASIGVDDVRNQILSEVYKKPYLAKRRVFIVGEGDRLSVQAQNALLKVLEEPPSYATFIICVTKQDILLDTVLSRSQILTFFPLSASEVEEYLKKTYGNAENTRLVAQFSQGSIGAAKAMISDEKTIRLFEESVRHMLLLKRNAAEIKTVADFLIGEKEHIKTVINFMQTFLRDCVFVKSGMENRVIYESKCSEMRVFCEGIRKKGLVSAFDRLADFLLRLKQNLNFNASVNETVMRIWEDFHDKGSGHQI